MMFYEKKGSLKSYLIYRKVCSKNLFPFYVFFLHHNFLEEDCCFFSIFNMASNVFKKNMPWSCESSAYRIRFEKIFFGGYNSGEKIRIRWILFVALFKFHDFLNKTIKNIFFLFSFFFFFYYIFFSF